LRLLLLGETVAWLPPWKQGRIIIGSGPTADARLAGDLLPFHCLVELDPREGEGAIVHDLARRGDVTDARGRAPGPEGSRLRANDRFRVGRHELALVADEAVLSDVSTSGADACVVCRGPAHVGRGRTVAGVHVCPGCLGVPDAQPDSCPGYELVARLGSGGMGAVYLALGPDKTTLVAVKLVRPREGRPSDGLLQRFRREIKLLSRLEHPGIVKVLDSGTAADALYLVCEFLAGGDLSARIKRTGRLPAGAAARLGQGLAEALEHAHRENVLHRDVKPSNVLLDARGTAKLGDFGLATELERIGIATTASGVGLGTLAYSAPEQLRRARDAGPPADVFALAATLYHAVTGKSPRADLTLTEMRALESRPLPSARSICPEVPEELSALLDRALHFDPGKRPTAGELGKGFATFARRAGA
jgi:serine/threonine protein kinase